MVQKRIPLQGSLERDSFYGYCRRGSYALLAAVLFSLILAFLPVRLRR